MGCKESDEAAFSSATWAMAGGYRMWWVGKRGLVRNSSLILNEGVPSSAHRVGYVDLDPFFAARRKQDQTT